MGRGRGREEDRAGQSGLGLGARDSLSGPSRGSSEAPGRAPRAASPAPGALFGASSSGVHGPSLLPPGAAECNAPEQRLVLLPDPLGKLDVKGHQEGAAPAVAWVGHALVRHCKGGAALSEEREPAGQHP